MLDRYCEEYPREFQKSSGGKGLKLLSLLVDFDPYAYRFNESLLHSGKSQFLFLEYDGSEGLNLLGASIPRNGYFLGGRVYVCMHEIREILPACWITEQVAKLGWLKAAWLRCEQDEQEAEPILLVPGSGLVLSKFQSNRGDWEGCQVATHFAGASAMRPSLAFDHYTDLVESTLNRAGFELLRQLQVMRLQNNGPRNEFGSEFWIHFEQSNNPSIQTHPRLQDYNRYHQLSA
ncbi:hypothetical protein VNO77_19403 [Canavalia gladiata]|uniref:Uncharacterized protein n=1 Tax=Canavalia gladiata TaxID=3824 RepID=A0AAN9LML0_CANGL